MKVRLIVAALLLAGLVAACSPEDVRRTGGGPGADPGNRHYPLPQLHGNRARNNPSARVPAPGRAPATAKGVPGYWAGASR
jgi:hypothetical protein